MQRVQLVQAVCIILHRGGCRTAKLGKSGRGSHLCQDEKADIRE